jgi:hypothetical protein
MHVLTIKKDTRPVSEIPRSTLGMTNTTRLLLHYYTIIIVILRYAHI